MKFRGRTSRLPHLHSKQIPKETAKGRLRGVKALIGHRTEEEPEGMRPEGGEKGEGTRQVKE